jgi:uncharacterized protein YjbI with pentapeptide repeats
MDPYRFEHFVADLWEQMEFQTEVIQQSQDRGIDLRATRPPGETVLIQAKRHGPESMVRDPKIREYAGLYKQEEGIDKVYVVTTNRFTSQARETADECGVELVDSERLTELINQYGKDNFVNSYCSDKDLTTADHSEKDRSNNALTNANLSTVNLSDKDLTDTDLFDKNLTSADLTNATLCGADLSDKDLSNATLTNANLSRADLSDATLTDADLSRADLWKADLTDATLTDATLPGAALIDPDFADKDLSGANLRGAALTNANLRGANLTNAGLRGADLSGTNASDANLSNANLPSLIYTDISGEKLRCPICKDWKAEWESGHPVKCIGWGRLGRKFQKFSDQTGGKRVEALKAESQKQQINGERWSR